jgi:hypothetical protein
MELVSKNQRGALNHMNEEMIELIRERMENMSLAELNALVAANFAEWRKNAGGPEDWNPAGNPAHMHDIADKLLEDGLFVNLFGRPSEWTCEIMDNRAVVYAEITSSTMARAVCEAALITVLTKYGEMLKVE